MSVCQWELSERGAHQRCAHTSTAEEKRVWSRAVIKSEAAASGRSAWECVAWRGAAGGPAPGVVVVVFGEGGGCDEFLRDFKCGADSRTVERLCEYFIIQGKGGGEGWTCIDCYWEGRGGSHLND